MIHPQNEIPAKLYRIPRASHSHFTPRQITHTVCPGGGVRKKRGHARIHPKVLATQTAPSSGRCRQINKTLSTLRRAASENPNTSLGDQVFLSLPVLACPCSGESYCPGARDLFRIRLSHREARGRASFFLRVGGRIDWNGAPGTDSGMLGNPLDIGSCLLGDHKETRGRED